MARENQLMQIALILCVMLIVFLSVATFLFFQSLPKGGHPRQDHHGRPGQVHAPERGPGPGTQETSARSSAPTRKSRSRTPRGTSTTRSRSTASSRRRRAPTASWSMPWTGRWRDRNEKLAASKAECQSLEDKLREREGTTTAQLNQIKEEQNKAASDLTTANEKFHTDYANINSVGTATAARLVATRKEEEAKIAGLNTQIEALKAKVLSTSNQVADLNKKYIKVTAPKPDTMAGEIQWVNQDDKTVWVNVGRADGLKRLISFAVYPRDANDIKHSESKGSIEISRLLGDHIAEGRVISASDTDPILPGDKIATSVWSPGDHRHYALAGVMDLYGDGTNYMREVRNAITMSGGVVDAEMQGKKIVGEITVNTNNLVLGKAPDAKSTPEDLANFTHMRDMADKLGIVPIDVKELFRQMGRPLPTKAVKYGLGANVADFQPTPPEGGPKTAQGTVTDLFEHRKPPQHPLSTY